MSPEQRDTLIATVEMLKCKVESTQRELNLLLCSIHILEGEVEPPSDESRDSDGLMTSSEVIKILGISKTTLNRYKLGQVPNGKSPFPRPVARHAEGKVYRRLDILVWKHKSID